MSDIQAVQLIALGLTSPDPDERQVAADFLRTESPERVRLLLILFGMETPASRSYLRRVTVACILVGLAIGQGLYWWIYHGFLHIHASGIDNFMPSMGLSVPITALVWYAGIYVFGYRYRRAQVARIFGPEVRSWRLDPRPVAEALDAARNPAFFPVLLEARGSYFLRVRTGTALYSLLDTLGPEHRELAPAEDRRQFYASVLNVDNVGRHRVGAIRVLRAAERMADLVAEPYARRLTRTKRPRLQEVREAAEAYLKIVMGN